MFKNIQEYLDFRCEHETLNGLEPKNRHDKLTVKVVKNTKQPVQYHPNMISITRGFVSYSKYIVLCCW